MAAYYGKKERLPEIQSWYDGQRYTAHSIVSIWIMNRESGRQKGAYEGLVSSYIILGIYWLLKPLYSKYFVYKTACLCYNR